jgi:hypothetical protein
VKLTVTLNVALAAASIALHQQNVGWSGPFLLFLLALGVAALAALLIREVTRRMTATRNEGVAPEQYLIAHGIDVKGITDKEPVEEFSPAHDEDELRLYNLIVFASPSPTLVVWWLALFAVLPNHGP